MSEYQKLQKTSSADSTTISTTKDFYADSPVSSLPVSPKEFSSPRHSVAPTPFPYSINDDSVISSNDNIFRRFWKAKILPNLEITCLLAFQILISLMMLFCKLLVTPQDSQPEKTPLHPFQIMFVRMLITYLGYVYHFVKIEPKPDFPFGPKRYRLMMILRGVGGFVGVCGQYMSLMYLNTSDTITITLLGPPVASILASFTLGQVLTKIELGFGGLAFIGVLLVAQPEFLFGGGDEEGSALSHFIGCCFAFFSIFGSAVAICCSKKICFHVHPLLTESFYALVSCFMSALLGTIFVPDFYRLPDTLRDWVLILLIGVGSFVMQYSLFLLTTKYIRYLTSGVQREKKTSRAVDITYSQLVFASFFDYIFFSYIPEGLELVGKCVVICAVMYFVYFQSDESRDASAPTFNATKDEEEFSIDFDEDRFKNDMGIEFSPKFMLPEKLTFQKFEALTRNGRGEPIPVFTEKEEWSTDSHV
ncbi:unnamed protein product [Ambrosiozyma monospora]|uniref:Unnamed protein product n=1 Tax=Ambrosiozyma monospora TaxID=43982 RepID=A0A9W7DHT2_AMBMO|nr:unnamed protein product [Ambrosiozyma monospora]